MDRQIVVCDGESHVVRAISLKFMRADFDVKGATDVESCWRLLHGHEPQELLIVGDELPSRDDTVALIRRIRSDARLAQIPIVLLTTVSRESMPQSVELKSLKVAEIVTKPFSPRELLATVCGLLGHESKSGDTHADSGLSPRFADRNRTTQPR